MAQVDLNALKQSLIAKIEEKLSKERRSLELETKLRSLKNRIDKLLKSGISQDDENLITFNQERDAFLEERTVLANEIITLRNEIADLKNQIMQVISPGLISEEPSPLFMAIFPTILFPVRLETRYLQNGGVPELRIRIYPDDIAIQTHEPSISEAEYEAGCRYIRRIWWAGKEPCPEDDEDKDDKEEEWKDRWNSAWLEIANEYGPQRAAYIVHLFRKIEMVDDPSKIARNCGGMPQYMKELDNFGNPIEDDLPEPDIVPMNELDLLDGVEINLRPEAWSEPPRSFVMPDFFILRFYRDGNLVYQKLGNPIPSPLHVGPAPVSTTDEEQPPDLLFFDTDSKWVVDYGEAVTKGMAITVTNADKENINIEDGFSLILAIGVKATVDPDANKAAIESLIESHRFTEGFTFVKQGTPTNNVVNSESGFSRTTDPMKHYELEFNHSPLEYSEDSTVMNGPRFARALGINQDILNHIENADSTEDRNAMNMIEALWPITMGYYLEAMLGKGKFGYWGTEIGQGTGFLDHFTELGLPKIIDLIKGYYVDYVRGRGPLSAIRFGDNPYGILPITSLHDWVPAILDFWDEEVNESEQGPLQIMMLEVIKKLTPYWAMMAASKEKIPRAGDGDDPAQELTTILGMGPSSRDALIRPFVTIIYLYNLFWFWGHYWWGWIPYWLDGLFESLGMPTNDNWLEDWHLEYQRRWEYFRTQFNDMHVANSAFPDLNPFVLGLTAWGEGYELWNLRRTAGTSTVSGEEVDEIPLIPFVQTEPVTEEESIEGETETLLFIDWLKSNIGDIDVIRESDNDWNSLLYNLLRMSVLISGNETQGSLEYLRDLPPAELERLLGETLDLFTNRLDSLITSFASRRLDFMRKVVPEGVHIGAYGWVENLQKDEQGRVNEGGYIVAPSHSQAAAGAVLRNAFLSHTAEEGKEMFAIKLTSDRVRNALWLTDGIRQGQSLSTLLGYRFEKGLFENYLEVGLELGTCVYEFRKLYPLEVLQETHAKGVDTETTEVVVPRNVVDGLELINAWRRTKINESNPIPFSSNDVLPRSGTDEYNAIATELDCIEDALDSINDLALYESIFHNVRGNFDRAPAMLDVLAGSGGIIPEPESILTPRTGFTFKHRVVVLCSIGDQMPDNVWSIVSPKSTSSPELANWLGSILGDPTNFVCRYEYEGMPDDADPFISLGTMANDQGFGPLEFLTMSTAEIGGGSTELEKRIQFQIMPAGVSDPEFKIRLDFNPNGSWNPDHRSLLEIIPLARRLQLLISDSRFLEPTDLLHPESADGDPTAVYTEDEFDDHYQLVEDTLTLLENLCTQLNPTPDNIADLRTALLSASLFNVKSSIPLSDLQDDLTNQVVDVEKELSKRFESATTLLGQAQSTKDAYDESGDTDGNKDTMILRQAIRILSECLKCIFNSPSVALHYFNLRSRAEVESSFSNMIDEGKSILWMQKAAHTHQKLKRFEDVMILSEALTGEERIDLEVGQLPQPSNNRWLALNLGDTTLEDYQQGSLSLTVLPSSGSLKSNNPGQDLSDLRLTGFVVDEWDETIPSATVNAAITYHYNRPNTEAPQCVLLAVPPVFDKKYAYRIPEVALISQPTTSEISDESEASDIPTKEASPTSNSVISKLGYFGYWNLEHLAKSIEETIQLTRIRAVDIDAMCIPEDIEALEEAIDGWPGWWRWFGIEPDTVDFENMFGFGHFLPALFIPTKIDEEDGDSA